MNDQRNVWRDDNRSSEQPTVDKIVICAEDVAEEGVDYNLVICHVRSLEGRGFIPSVRSRRTNDMQNGDLVLGPDDLAYDLTKVMGSMLLAEKEEKEPRDFQEFINKMCAKKVS